MARLNAVLAKEGFDAFYGPAPHPHPPRRARRSEREGTDGGGHGRFWYAPGRVILAHRFAFAVMIGVDALERARLLGHRCHNPLCQRSAHDHVVVSSAVQNRHEWAVQRRLPYSRLVDPRGPRCPATVGADHLVPAEKDDPATCVARIAAR